MKSPSGIPFSSIVFHSDSAAPRYRQLYAHIRDLILDGSLAAGMRLPSSRELAREIGVARNTVIGAYELLVDEQFADSVVGRGTVVRALPALTPSVIPAAVSSVDAPADAPTTAPLRMGFALPDGDNFPSPAWEKVVRSAVRNTGAVREQPPVEGLPRLRKLLCAYLGAYRGVRCREEQVLVTTGGQQGLYLAARVLREFSEGICVEDPGYISARTAFFASGLTVHPLPVDENGLQFTRDTPAEFPQTKVVYLTPSHQFPLGATLSLERRLEILAWARDNNGWIIEDDYDAEYRYDGDPLTALAGLDTAQRVIYTGTFSKVLSPALRIGYLVVPEALIERFRVCKALIDGAGAVLMQNAIADFIDRGYFQTHLRQMRALYRDKRDQLLDKLRQYHVQVEALTHTNGMHVTLMLSGQQPDTLIAKEMAHRGFETIPLSKHYLRAGEARQGLLVGFTSARNEDIEDFAARLAEVTT